MTETTTPTLEQMREILEETRAVLTALDAKGETTGEEGDGYDGVIRARNYFAAPPLAPTEEQGEHESSCGFYLYGPPAICDCGRPRMCQEPFQCPTWDIEGCHCEPTDKEVEDAIDHLATEAVPGREHEVQHLADRLKAALREPSSDASAPQTDEAWTRDLITAGWRERRVNTWICPDGTLWRGPYGAWCELQRRKAETREPRQ